MDGGDDRVIATPGAMGWASMAVSKRVIGFHAVDAAGCPICGRGGWNSSGPLAASQLGPDAAERIVAADQLDTQSNGRLAWPGCLRDGRWSRR